MKKYTFIDGGYTFQRIDKKAARRAYNVKRFRVLQSPREGNRALYGVLYPDSRG